ncbi:MAG: hypothetical protein OXI16_07365 [Chloroflexota bacterium]|nr:hypothetical protein [Chloroflexota bacterium]
MELVIAMPIGYAEKVRNYVIRLVDLARHEEATSIQVRAGDVRDALGVKFISDIYDICQVLSTKKFREQAGVELLSKTGPAQGVNTIYHFSILENSLELDGMSQADEIRKYVVDSYVEPARRSGKQFVEVLVNEVFHNIGTYPDQTAVAQALALNRFHTREKIALVEREGYRRFLFEILDPSEFTGTGISIPYLSDDDTQMDNIREHIYELTPSEFQELTREYLKAKGFADAEMEIVIRMRM